MILNKILIDEYLKDQKRLASTTIELHCSVLSKLMNDFKDQDLALLTSNEIQEWCYNKLENGLAVSTIQSQVRVLNYFFKYMLEEGCINSNIIENIELPAVINEPPISLNDVEILRLKEAVQDNPRNSAMIALFLDTGLRLQELRKLETSNIDWNNNQILVKDTKSYRDRMVYFTDICKIRLLKYLALKNNNNPYFIVSRNRTEMSSVTVQKIVKQSAIKANISKKVTPQVLRYTNATILNKKGFSLEEIAHLLGHINLNTTKYYLSSDSDWLKNEYIKYYT